MKLGWPIKKTVPHELDLPVITKCVITTSDRFEWIRDIQENNADAVMSTIIVTDPFNQEASDQFRERLRNLWERFITSINIDESEEPEEEPEEEHNEPEESDNLENRMGNLRM